MSDTVLQQIPPSYLYGQYNSDPTLKATRDAYNLEAQGIFSWLQNNPIADYRSDPISGQLLDFVGQGLYNMTRKIMISTVTGGVTGALGDEAYGQTPFASGVYQQADNIAINLSDDQFRRSITWNIYSGDGWTFSTSWLRNRITRFIFNANGFGDAAVNDQQLVSIVWSALRTATVFVQAPTSSLATASILQIGLGNGYLQKPIGYTITIVLLNYQTSQTDFGGDIL